MLLAVLLLTACKQRTVYYHYEHTPLSGWEKNDTLVFTTDTIAIDGTYSEEVGIRINGTYPFLQLNLVVEHLVMPAMTVKSDTLSCRLIDETGNALGNGVSNYQYLIEERRPAAHRDTPRHEARDTARHQRHRTAPAADRLKRFGKSGDSARWRTISTARGCARHRCAGR